MAFCAYLRAFELIILVNLAKKNNREVNYNT